VIPVVEGDARNLYRLVVAKNLTNSTKNNTVDNSIVSFTNDSHPGALLNAGHHTDNCPLNRYPRTIENVPMGEMIKQVKEQELHRPLVCNY
jgi:hypothetical protein